MVAKSNANQASPPSLLGYLRASLLGISQVFFLANLWTALFFLAAISWYRVGFGVAALAGSLVATGTAYLVRAPAQEVRTGLHGFNGTLVAMGLLLNLGDRFPDRVALWGLILLGAGLSTLVQLLFVRLLTPYQIPVSTGPFVLTAWLMLTVGLGLGAQPPPPALLHLPGLGALGQWLDGTTFLTGLFKGIGEVLFLDSALSGALILLGIFVGNWQGGIMAALGAAVGVILPALWGADRSAVQMGLFAFNPTLAAMALGAIFSRFGWRSVGLGLAAALICLLITPGLAGWAGRYGLPGFTAPFVLTLYMLMAARHLGRRRNPS